MYTIELTTISKHPVHYILKKYMLRQILYTSCKAYFVPEGLNGLDPRYIDFLTHVHMFNACTHLYMFIITTTS